jgi:hypothetical protein
VAPCPPPEHSFGEGQYVPREIDGVDLEFVARGDSKVRVVGENIEHTEVTGWVRFAQIR